MNNSRLLKGIIILIILIEVIICIFDYFIFTDIKNRSNHTIALKNDLDVQTEKQQHLSSMEQIINNTDSNIAVVESSIVQKGEDVKFIENLETMAKNNRLSINIKSLSLSKPATVVSKDLVVLSIDMDLTGSWTDMYSFLQQLELMPIKVKINTASLSDNPSISPDNNAGTGVIINKQWQGTFKISVLNYK